MAKTSRMRRTKRNHKKIEAVMNDIVVFDRDKYRFTPTEQVFLWQYIQALQTGQRVIIQDVAHKVKPDVPIRSAGNWAYRVLQKVNQEITINNAFAAVGIDTISLAQKVREGLDANETIVTKNGKVIERPHWPARTAVLGLALKVRGDIKSGNDKDGKTGDVNMQVNVYQVNLPEKSLDGDFSALQPVIPEGAREIKGVIPEPPRQIPERIKK